MHIPVELRNFVIMHQDPRGAKVIETFSGSYTQLHAGIYKYKYSYILSYADTHFNYRTRMWVILT